jgi:glycosyltransferase involved in cell wall biosynthesis
MIDPWGSGGIHDYSVALCEALGAAGCEVSLMTARHAECVPEGAGFTQARVFEGFVSHPSWAVGPVRRARSLMLHKANLARLERAMAAGWDIVHFQWPLTRFGGASVERAGKRSGVIVTAHNARPHDAVVPAVIADWSAAYSSADAIICHTGQTVQDMESLYGRETAQKCMVIPHGIGVPSWLEIDTSDRGACRMQLDLPADARLVLFFGAIRPYKGLDVLLDAWPRVVRDVPGALLVIAGQAADYSEYEALIGAGGVDSSVISRIGWIETADVPRYLCAADLTVLPYRHIDGSGVAADAAYYGTPMVLSSIAGFTGQWRGDEVFFCDVDAVSVADAIVAALQAPAEALSRAGRARRRSLADASWASVARAHLRAYAALAGTKG